MKQLLIAVLLSMTLLQGAWASNASVNDDGPDIKPPAVAVVTEPSSSFLEAHDLIRKEIVMFLFLTNQDKVLAKLAMTSKTMLQEVRSRLIPLLKDRIQELTENPEEFKEHHWKAIVGVHLALIRDGLKKEIYVGALRVGPCYTKHSKIYYNLPSYVTGDKLCLQGENLVLLPPALGTLTQLHHLNLAENSLLHLPASIGKLTELRTLSIAGNPFEVLPETIINLVNLETLTLRETQNKNPTTIKRVRALKAAQKALHKEPVNILCAVRCAMV